MLNLNHIFSRIPKASNKRSIRINLLQYKLISFINKINFLSTPLNNKNIYELAIITSTYKAEHYIAAYKKALITFQNSIQNFPVHIQIFIIANDPSSNELAKLNSLLKEINSDKIEMQLITVQREPLYASWNRGIQLSTAKYICFWNIDDIRFAPALLQAIHFMEQSKTDLVYFPYLRSVSTVYLLHLHKYFIYNPPLFKNRSLLKEFYLGPFFICSRRLFDKVGLFDVSFSIAGDFEWALRAVKNSKPILINKLAGIFFDNGTGLSTIRSQANIDEDNRIRKMYNNEF